MLRRLRGAINLLLPKKFNVATPGKFSALTFRIRRDDAAAVWLNNEAIPRVVSADGAFNPPYTYGMTGTANAVPGSTNTNSCVTYAISLSKLVAGDNILAVEVHPDFAHFERPDSGLRIDREPDRAILTRAGGQPALYWFDNGATLEESTDFTLWTPLPGAQSPLPLDLSGPGDSIGCGVRQRPGGD